ncbi:A disintegrin and metalloproteinase with thrombospondin motifs 17-like [Anneissia japonica]|uniref:A disintegrin and metalloproteinase with thrombospondin motifs 17-like n=1 Tax=Anneissia japonica TaxID=1529436 RepID=UPI0014255B15|nr:A disintegrin and metalloproteinase with thrombospondin motifs 17-like [Anneissia japonica]
MTGCQQSGYAPLGGMCGGRSSLSVARADGLQATSEEAHELGHNLGIVHDGEASGGCYDSMHIMSVSQTGTVGNDFTWSTCSAQQLADNLK